ncbi:hypothetical protein A2U01_0111529, partial [Trifolium medium]|nr:hypothetical protein [Trifolium medium]
RKSLFRIFEESVRGFKEKFYGFRPITGNGWKTIVTHGPRKDEDGNVVKGPDDRNFYDVFSYYLG